MNSHSDLLQLPEELWMDILVLLQPRELGTLSVTNKFFHRLTEEPSLWQRYYWLQFGHNARTRYQEDQINWKAEYYWRIDPRNRIELFQEMPVRCIKSMLKDRLINSQEELIRFLQTPGLNRNNIYQILVRPQQVNFDESLLECYLKMLGFENMSLVDALRKFVWNFGMPRDQGGMRYTLRKFSESYFSANPNSGIFSSGEEVYLLVYSIIMLNTDLHHPGVKLKMQCKSFVGAVQVIEGLNASEEYLKSIYYSIQNEEICEEGKLPYDVLLKSISKHKLDLSDQPVVHSGWLKVKHWMGLKKRWFILTPNYLMCYKKKPFESSMNSPSGYIEFKYDTQLHKPALNGNSQNFAIESRSHIYTLTAVNERDAQEWLNALSESILKLKAATDLAWNVFLLDSEEVPSSAVPLEPEI